MTKNEIILMADASGLSFYGMGKDRDKFLHYLKAFAALVAKHEREACAKVAEEYATGESRDYSENIAEEIRARGENT